MVADSLDELHAFAKKVGIKRCYFHGVRKGHPHYDVFGCLLMKIAKEEVKKVRPRELLQLSKQMK